MRKRDLKVIYHPSCTEADLMYMSAKGIMSNVIVQLPDGSDQRMTFMDLARLQEDASFDFQRGEPCFTEEGLVIVPEVTVDAIERAVRHMWDTGFWSGGWRYPE